MTLDCAIAALFYTMPIRTEQPTCYQLIGSEAPSAGTGIRTCEKNAKTKRTSNRVFSPENAISPPRPPLPSHPGSPQPGISSCLRGFHIQVWTPRSPFRVSTRSSLVLSSSAFICVHLRIHSQCRCVSLAERRPCSPHKWRAPVSGTVIMQRKNLKRIGSRTDLLLSGSASPRFKGLPLRFFEDVRGPLGFGFGRIRQVGIQLLRRDQAVSVTSPSVIKLPLTRLDSPPAAGITNNSNCSSIS